MHRAGGPLPPTPSPAPRTSAEGGGELRGHPRGLDFRRQDTSAGGRGLHEARPLVPTAGQGVRSATAGARYSESVPVKYESRNPLHAHTPTTTCQARLRTNTAESWIAACTITATG